MLLDALVKGMRDAGAEVEMVRLRKKTVKNCIGCFTCWAKAPGVAHIRTTWPATYSPGGCRLTSLPMPPLCQCNVNGEKVRISPEDALFFDTGVIFRYRYSVSIRLLIPSRIQDGA